MRIDRNSGIDRNSRIDRTFAIVPSADPISG